MSLLKLLVGTYCLVEICIGQSITPAPTGMFHSSSGQLNTTTSKYASIMQLLFFSTRVYGRLLCSNWVPAIHSLFHDVRLLSRWILRHNFRCLNANTNTLLGRQTDCRDDKPSALPSCRSSPVRQFSRRPRLGDLRREWVISRTHGKCRHYCSCQC